MKRAFALILTTLSLWPAAPCGAETWKETNTAVKRLLGENKVSEAEARLRQAADAARNADSIYGIDAAAPLEALSDLYTKKGRFTEAEPPLLEAHKLKEAAYGAEDEFLAPTALKLALLYKKMQRYGDSERYFDVAEKIWGSALYPNLPQMALLWEEKADLYKLSGHLDLVPALEEKAAKARLEYKERTGKDAQ